MRTYSAILCFASSPVVLGDMSCDHARAARLYAPTVVPAALREVACQLYLLGGRDVTDGSLEPEMPALRIAEEAAARSVLHSVGLHPLGLLQAVVAAEAFAAVAVSRWREVSVEHIRAMAELDEAALQIIGLTTSLRSHRAAIMQYRRRLCDLGHDPDEAGDDGIIPGEPGATPPPDSVARHWRLAGRERASDGELPSSSDTDPSLGEEWALPWHIPQGAPPPVHWSRYALSALPSGVPEWVAVDLMVAARAAALDFDAPPQPAPADAMPQPRSPTAAAADGGAPPASAAGGGAAFIGTSHDDDRPRSRSRSSPGSRRLRSRSSRGPGATPTGP